MDTTKENDFKPEEFSRTAEQHGKDISDLFDRVSALEKKFDPSEIATTLEAASEDSKKLDKFFSKTFCDMMENDTAVKSAIDDRMSKTDRKALASTMKRWGGHIGKGVIFILGILVSLLVQWFFKKKIGQ